MKKIKTIELMTLTMMILPNMALAQGSGSHGGGEDGVFKSIRDEVSSWMQKNIAINQLETKLELKSMSGTALYASFAEAVSDVGEKVVFTTEEIKIGNNSRICKNENKTITCNVDAWNNTRGDTRYMIVFHEYLGVAGIETNVETDYSKYPISSKILGYVKTKESFELGMERADPDQGMEGIVRMAILREGRGDFYAYEFVTKDGAFLLRDTDREIYSSVPSNNLNTLLNRKVILIGEKVKERYSKYGLLNTFVVEDYKILPETELVGKIFNNQSTIIPNYSIFLSDGRDIEIIHGKNITFRGFKNRNCSIKGEFIYKISSTYHVNEIKCSDQPQN